MDHWCKKQYTEFFEAPFVESGDFRITGQDHHDLFYELYNVLFPGVSLGKGVRPAERATEPKDRNVLERLRAIKKAQTELLGGLDTQAFTGIKALMCLTEENQSILIGLIAKKPFLKSLWKRIGDSVMQMDPEKLRVRLNQKEMVMDKIKGVISQSRELKKSKETIDQECIYEIVNRHFETLFEWIPRQKEFVQKSDEKIGQKRVVSQQFPGDAGTLTGPVSYLAVCDKHGLSG